MKKKTHELLIVMKVLTWIIFLGLCIKTGALIISFFVSEFINPLASKNLYLGFDLSNLKEFSNGQYSAMVVLIIVLSALKAFMFYHVIKFFFRLNLLNPFSADVALLIKKISYVAFAIGTLTMISIQYSRWLSKNGVVFTGSMEFIDSGAAFLFFSGIIFIISLVFKKGIEIQTENELTV
jgi:hypothetical protein